MRENAAIYTLYKDTLNALYNTTTFYGNKLGSKSIYIYVGLQIFIAGAVHVKTNKKMKYIFYKYTVPS